MPPYTITHWDRRNFALYDGEDLLAVTLYPQGAIEGRWPPTCSKKGATRLKEELTKRDTEINKRSLAPIKSTHEPLAN